MAPGIGSKLNNNLPVYGNEKTMNLNNLILTNIQSSHYFKVNLFELKTYHEVIDEIYYKVNHLEPWEKGSRKTAGQTGMCGGVRGVGAGGIVSTAFCLLYKLFTLKLTRKQLNGLITHADSPYIRALGFMYIRYTQPPADLWDWYEAYLDDPEELDVKAGGGATMAIGEMLHHFLSKLEWYSTLFPRIAVPVQKDIENKLGSRPIAKGRTNQQHIPDEEVSWGEAERISQLRRSPNREIRPPHSPPRKNASPHNKPRPEVDDIAVAIARERESQQRDRQSRERPSQNRDRLGSSRDRDREKYGRSSKEQTKDKRITSKDHRDRHEYDNKSIPFRGYSRTQKEHSHDPVYRYDKDRSKDKDPKYRSRSPIRDLASERSKSAEKRGNNVRHHDSARPDRPSHSYKSKDRYREKPLNPKNHKNKEYSSTSLSIEGKRTAYDH